MTFMLRAVLLDVNATLTDPSAIGAVRTKPTSILTPAAERSRARRRYPLVETAEQRAFAWDDSTPRGSGSA